MRIGESNVNSYSNRQYSKTYGGGVAQGASFGGFVESRVEKEQTNYGAEGKVKTQDGREIDVDLKMEMARTKKHDTFIQLSSPLDALCDPLIINIDAKSVSLSDSKFKFDLDADGKDDEISCLGKGSGFLALDKNGDGHINDGTELFGVKSGDGFKDLAEYDKDNNGWIDEDDEIFNDLKVWYRDENGIDRLIDLKEAGVGAIYLGSESTEFTMEGNDEALDGKLRRTGFFLKENGEAGTIQHVDLAIKGRENELLTVEEQMEQVLDNIKSNQSRSRRNNNNAQREAKARAQKAAKRKADLKKHYEKQEEYRKMVKEWHESKPNQNLLN